MANDLFKVSLQSLPLFIFDLLDSKLEQFTSTYKSDLKNGPCSYVRWGVQTPFWPEGYGRSDKNYGPSMRRNGMEELFVNNIFD